jgi:hypothetical protein
MSHRKVENAWIKRFFTDMDVGQLTQNRQKDLSYGNKYKHVSYECYSYAGFLQYSPLEIPRPPLLWLENQFA